MTQYQGKDVGEVKILWRNDLIKQEEREPATMNINPPPEVYIEDILHPEYLEETLVLVWDKKTSPPSFDPEDDVFWVGPYVVKEFKNDLYSLSTLDGRKMPMGFSASHLRPYIDGTYGLWTLE